jgi:hypothetical protein
MKQFIVSIDRGYGYVRKMRIQGYYHQYSEKTKRHESIPITTPELARKEWERAYPSDNILSVEEAPDLKPSPVGGDLTQLAAIVNG